MPLKNDLHSSSQSDYKSEFNSYGNNPIEPLKSESKSSKIIKGILFGAFIITFMAFLFNTTSPISSPQEILTSTATSAIQDFNSPSSKLLRDMGEWMERMGYEGLTEKDLKALREKGLTATYTSKIRDLGYDPSIDELLLLRKHDVSATFASMMHSLGYTQMTIDDMVRLRVHGVTAHYTSNLHDLGYDNITLDELVRLKDAKMSITKVKRVNDQRSTNASVEDLIRYGISNQ